MAQDNFENDYTENNELDFYTLVNGKKIYVFEDSISGMAGEPCSFLQFLDENKKPISYLDINKLFTTHDADEIFAWMNRLSEDNKNSAISYCR